MNANGHIVIYLQERALLLRGGSIMDASLIAAPPSAKNDAGKVHDTKLTDDLIRPDDAAIFGGKGYVSNKRKRAARARGAAWAVKYKRRPGRVLPVSQKKRNKKHGVVRAKAEHVFRIIKCRFDYRKVRYHGLAKTKAKLYLARRCLKEESA